MARLEDYDISERHAATVVESTLLTPKESDVEIREIVLEVNRPHFAFDPGQSVGVLVPGPHAFGNEYHHRLYTVADLPEKAGDKPRVTLCVKRVTYVDEYSGERYKGIASHYLCDRKAGDEILTTGPFGLPFTLPDDPSSDLLMIGMGTGIAPFRAFVKHIYKNGGWKGKVRLFYGARSGLEMVYMNDRKNDFAHYYDEETFKAFQALSPRPHWADPIAIDRALQARSEEMRAMLSAGGTHVYIAGLESVRETLEKAFADIFGSKEKWARRKAELIAGKRWMELIY